MSVIIDDALGSTISSAFPVSLKADLIRAFTRAIAENTPLHLDYECSSPGIFVYSTRPPYPLARSAGLRISNHLVQLRPHTEDEHRFSSSL